MIRKAEAGRNSPINVGLAGYAEKWHNSGGMEKHFSSAAMSSPQGAAKTHPEVTIWCIHYECYKYINVCKRCRVRIKCMNYLDYWAPRFDF
ncbi:MAG: hypothetical protein M0Z67_17060 [Nitrospiraceae bacterium]|nr:hypothetical protein [Nitrospiraceae bacterium]